VGGKAAGLSHSYCRIINLPAQSVATYQQLTSVAMEYHCPWRSVLLAPREAAEPGHGLRLYMKGPTAVCTL
jgi:hypothetical protein